MTGEALNNCTPVTGLNSESSIYISTAGLIMWHLLKRVVEDVDMKVWKYLVSHRLLIACWIRFLT